MEGRPLAFSNHCSENALSSAGGGGIEGGGGVAVMMMPQATDTISSTALNHLSTYTAGEDAGRLALLAKEFGLAKMRPPKRQIRKHTFKAFLRNHPNKLNEDIPHQPSTESDNTEYEIPIATIPSEEDTSNNNYRHAPLRFVFTGYSLWLELEQFNIDDNGLGDLDHAMIDAADRFKLGGAIPSPHVTALYGIDTISDEEEMRRVFREDVKCLLLDMAEKKNKKQNEDGGVGIDGEDVEVEDANVVEKLWPDLAATGIIVDTEFDGVQGGTMDMAWAEVSFATSPEHESLINALHELFYNRSCSSASIVTPSNDDDNEEKKEEYRPRSTPWVPHLSLCYDNPEGLGPTISRSLIEQFMKEKCPTLRTVLDDSSSRGDSGECVKFTRAVSGIALWRTTGTMAEWKCLDRYEFPKKKRKLEIVAPKPVLKVPPAEFMTNVTRSVGRCAIWT